MLVAPPSALLLEPTLTPAPAPDNNRDLLPIPSTRKKALNILKALKVKLSTDKVLFRARTQEEAPRGSEKPIKKQAEDQIIEEEIFTEPTLDEVVACQNKIQAMLESSIEIFETISVDKGKIVSLRKSLREAIEEYMFINIKVQDLHTKLANPTQIICLIGRCLDVLLGLDPETICSHKVFSEDGRI